MLIPPIPELDQQPEQRLISIKVSSNCFSLYLRTHYGPLQCPGPPCSRHHPSRQCAVRCSSRFHVGSIYNSTHTACCLLLKTQVLRAGHRYRPIDVRCASALTVPTTSQYLQKAQSCSRSDTTATAAQETSSPAGLPTLALHDSMASKQDTALPIRSVRMHAPHAEYIFLTKFSENDHPCHPPVQETEGTDRQRTTGRSLRH